MRPIIKKRYEVFSKSVPEYYMWDVTLVDSEGAEVGIAWDYPTNEVDEDPPPSTERFE